MEAVVARLRAASRPVSGSPSTATSTSTGSARPRSPSARCGALGAECDWLIPDRLADGYGLAAANLRAAAPRAAPTLLLTVDCGITAVAEVELARELGIEVIVTDHHQPKRRAARLPRSCTRPSAAIRSPSSAGPRVAWKLACGAARRGRAAPEAAPRPRPGRAGDRRRPGPPGRGEPHPGAARAGPDPRGARPPRAAGAARGGGCEPARLDEGDLAFRLAPRINAAGRLYRADAGVELFLTEDDERAAEIAAELDRANRERQGDRARGRVRPPRPRAASCPETLREAPALVLAGARLASRRGRDRRLAARRAPPQAGRPDLARRGRLRARLGAQHPGLRPARRRSRPARSTSTRFGGHRAAAGLELRPARSTPSARPSPTTPRASSARGAAPQTERIDAMVGGAASASSLAEELERLGALRRRQPGRPAAGSRPPGSATCGRWGRAGTPASACTAAVASCPRRRLRPLRLGAEEDSRSTRPCASRSTTGTARSSRAWCCASSTRWRGASRKARTLRAPLRRRQRRVVGALRGGARTAEPRPHVPGVPPTGAPGRPPPGRPPRRLAAVGPGRARLERRAGARRLRRCRRAGRSSPSAPPGSRASARGAGRVVCGRCATEETLRAREPPGARDVVLADYAALALAPDRAAGFEHVVLVDPPPLSRAGALVEPALLERRRLLHPAWGEAERELRARRPRRAARPAAARWPSLFRALREPAGR